MKRNVLSILLSGIVGLAGNTALAQYDSYGGAPTAVTTGIGAGLVIFWIIFMVINLALFVLWIWMLIDSIKQPSDKKAMWIILLIILGYLGAIIYYFAVKRKNKKGGGSAPSAQAPQAPQAPPPPAPQPPQA